MYPKKFGKIFKLKVTEINENIYNAMILSDSFKFLPKGVNIRVAPTKNPRNNELRKRHNRVHSVNHHKAKTNSAHTTPTPTLVNISPERKVVYESITTKNTTFRPHEYFCK